MIGMAPVRSKKIGTMEEFARAVGLSRPTVSKFFHDPASVRPKTRARIEAALKQSGFRPNIFAVNLNRRRTKIIGLIVPDPTDPFYMTLAQRIETEATEAGYLALVLSSNGRPEVEARAIETITALNVAGAIIAPLGEKSQHAKLKSLARETPLIFVDAPLDDEGPFVGTNNHQTIPLITEYLCRSGEPPTYLDMPKTNNNSRDRRSAYVATMERLELEPRFAGDAAGRLGLRKGRIRRDRTGIARRRLSDAHDPMPQRPDGIRGAGGHVPGRPQGGIRPRLRLSGRRTRQPALQRLHLSAADHRLAGLRRNGACRAAHAVRQDRQWRAGGREQEVLLEGALVLRKSA